MVHGRRHLTKTNTKTKTNITLGFALTRAHQFAPHAYFFICLNCFHLLFITCMLSCYSSPPPFTSFASRRYTSTPTARTRPSNRPPPAPCALKSPPPGAPPAGRSCRLVFAVVAAVAGGPPRASAAAAAGRRGRSAAESPSVCWGFGGIGCVERDEGLGVRDAAGVSASEREQNSHAQTPTHTRLFTNGAEGEVVLGVERGGDVEVPLQLGDKQPLQPVDARQRELQGLVGCVGDRITAAVGKLEVFGGGGDPLVGLIGVVWGAMFSATTDVRVCREDMPASSRHDPTARESL